MDDGHVIPHAATFKSGKDVTHGDVQKNLENMRAIQQAAINYVSPRTRLKQRLAACSGFDRCRPDFLHMLIDNSQEQILNPDEVVFSMGDPCAFGVAPFYVVLEGQITIENHLEVVLGYIQEGDVFGTGGAIGLVDERSNCARASKGRQTLLCRVDGGTLEAALVAFPEEKDFLEETFFKQQTRNHDYEKARESWITGTVVPALAGTPLLAGCPEEFLYDVGAPLLEKTYKDGQTIVTVGQPADSMLVVLEGTAEIQAKSGAKIGHLTEGASFGEVAALDLFPCRTATIKAVGRCRILNVTSKALSRAIKCSPEELIRVAFPRLVESRRNQVQRGLPMCALPISARPDDVCVRAVALQAERIDLAPGQTWVPLPDSDTCGPHFGILVKGKAVLETIEESRLVTVLSPGSLLPEGMAAEFRTHCRAITHCEAYRVRQNDFLVAVYSMPSAQEWFYRFRLLDKQVRAHLSSRLSAVRGVTEGIMPHPSDDDIHEWKTRRQKAMEKARRMKIGNKLPLMGKVPVLRPATSMTTSEQRASAMSRVKSAPALTQDLGREEVERSLRLPRLGTAG